MIRDTYKIVDGWKCIHALLNKQTATSPWSSWKVIKGFPEDDVFSDLGTPIIFTEPPQRIGFEQLQQGGEKTRDLYEMRIGAWDDRKTGGVEEINIISGKVLGLFGNMNVHCATFDVTLASAFSDTSLLAQGIEVEGITGPRVINTVNPKEFRHEFTLQLRM